MSGIFLNDIPHYLETGFLTEQSSHRLAVLSSSNLPVSASPPLKYPSPLSPLYHLHSTLSLYRPFPTSRRCYLVSLFPQLRQVKHTNVAIRYQCLYISQKCSICPVCGLSHLVYYFSTSIYLKISHFHFSLQLNKIPLYINISFIIRSSVDGHIGCFQLLAIVKRDEQLQMSKYL